MREPQPSAGALLIVVVVLSIFSWGGLYGLYLFVKHAWKFIF